MTNGMDFTKAHSKKYKVWRILTASTTWSRLYKSREEALRPYRGAIIFPEQLLGISHTIFKVKVEHRNDAVSSSIGVVRNYSIFADTVGMTVKEAGLLSTLDEIREWESIHTDGEAPLGMFFPNHRGEQCFINLPLFTNIRDAAKYQSDMQNRYIGQLS